MSACGVLFLRFEPSVQFVNIFSFFPFASFRHVTELERIKYVTIDDDSIRRREEVETDN